MKKLIFAIALMMAITLSSFGKTSNKNSKLAGNLSIALNAAKTILKNEQFPITSFYFNGKTVSAFYDVESNDLIGFSIPMSVNDLPAGTMENVEKKFGEYSYLEATMFIYKSGYFGFYVSLSRSKKPCIVLEINANDKAYYFAKM